MYAFIIPHKVHSPITNKYASFVFILYSCNWTVYIQTFVEKRNYYACLAVGLRTLEPPPILGLTILGVVLSSFYKSCFKD